MLIIRPAQIEAFEDSNGPDFALQMANHVRTAFPRHSALLAGQGVAEVVRHGIAQSRSSGLVSKSSARLFIDLTLLLGREFHRDPQLPWASNVLSAGFPVGAELERAHRLFGLAIDYLDSVSGPDNELIDQAQTRLMDEPLTIFASSGQEFAAQVLRRLQRIWPEKLRRLEDTSRMALLRDGVRKARSYGITSESGCYLVILSMYMLGSGFDQDPMFAWSRRILAATDNTAEKVVALERAGLAYLNAWCAGSETHRV